MTAAPAPRSRSSRRRALAMLGLLVAGALVNGAAVEADLLRKRMARRFPGNWNVIPQAQYEMIFRATGPSAKFGFLATNLQDGFGTSAELKLDNLAIVEREYYRGNLSPGFSYFETTCDSRLPVFESAFAPPTGAVPSGSPFNTTEPLRTQLPFFESFANDPFAGGPWVDVLGTNTWVASAVFPDGDASFPSNDAYLSFGGATDDQAIVDLFVDNLTAGKTYVLVGWWRIGNTPVPPNLEIFISGDVEEQPGVLLVDDDTDDPDVQPLYREALDRMGVAYEVLEPGSAGCPPAPAECEPDAARLAAHSTVLWFSGDKFDDAAVLGLAGPSAAAELDLATFLDRGGCLLVSSENYLYDQPQNAGLPNYRNRPSSFMTSHLGICDPGDTGTLCKTESDARYDQVDGVAGSFFAGLGTWTLSYPASFAEGSDWLAPVASPPEPGASVANGFDGSFLAGSPDGAAVYKQVPSSGGDGSETENGCGTAVQEDPAAVGYQTALFGFAVDSPLAAPARLELLARALKHCDLTCPTSVPYHAALGGSGETITSDQTTCNSIEVANATFDGVVDLQTGGFVLIGNDVTVASTATLAIYMVAPDP